MGNLVCHVLHKFEIIFSFFCICLLCIFDSKANIATSDTIKILAIGNSFSEDAVEQNLYELANADSIPIVIGNMYIGGCSLEHHVKNATNNIKDYSYRKILADGSRVRVESVTLKWALTNEDWDYVSLQQASPFSGIYETYQVDLPKLISYIKLYLSSDSQLMLHQTWAYSSDSTHKGFLQYNNSQMCMYKAIVDATKQASELVSVSIVIPAGTAIQNIRTSFIGDNLDRDGYHLNLLGRYVVACTWYESIFRGKLLRNHYIPYGINQAQACIAKKAAYWAIVNPWKITDIN